MPPDMLNTQGFMLAVALISSLLLHRLFAFRGRLRIGSAETVQDSAWGCLLRPLGPGGLGLRGRGQDLLPLSQLLECSLQLLHLLWGNRQRGPVCEDSDGLVLLELSDVEFLRRWRLLGLPLGQTCLLLEDPLRLLLAPGSLGRDLDAGLALCVVDRRNASPLDLEDALLLLQPFRRGLLHDVFEDLPVLAVRLHLPRDHLQQLGHKVVVHGQLHSVCEDARVEEVREGPVLETAEVRRCDAARHHLPHHAQVLLALRRLLLEAALHLLLPALLCGLHPLDLEQLGVAASLKVLLVPPEGLKLLFLEHLHHALLQGLAHQDLKHRLALDIEVEKLTVLDLGLDVHSDLRRHEERRRWPVEEEVGLRLGLELDRSLGELLEV
mmetsp:Transcript_20241/g.63625  ORF Transcript_20241/g.63625 Transcript_20241/m.63625 type:complete len:381 (-) Transcript_20241:377-1519(-)